MRSPSITIDMAPAPRAEELRNYGAEELAENTEKTERDAFGHLLALSPERIKETSTVYLTARRSE
jgi:hypothetical protein